MDAAERLAVSAALDKLARATYADQSELLDCLRTVIRFAVKLPVKKHDIQFIYNKKETTSFSAHTPQNGDVGVSSEEQKRKLIELGGKKERVGSYRVWRSEDHVSFHHFWASAETTNASDDELTYFLVRYNKLTLEPLEFGYWEEHWGLGFWDSRIFYNRFVFRYNKEHPDRKYSVSSSPSLMLGSQGMLFVFGLAWSLWLVLGAVF